MNLVLVLVLGFGLQTAEPLFRGKTQAQWESLHADLDPVVRLSVVNALSAFPSGSEEVLEKLAHDPQRSIRTEALQTLAARRVAPAVIRLFESKDMCEEASIYMSLNAEMRQAFLTAYAAQGSNGSVLCGVPDDGQSGAIGGRPGGLGLVWKELTDAERTAALPMVLASLKHASPLVRHASVIALGQTPMTPQTRQAVEALKKDPSPLVRSGAKYSLSAPSSK